MKAKLCKNLEEIRNNNPANYEKIDYIFTFLYQKIGQKYFNSQLPPFYDHLKRSLFQQYVESQTGIIKNLFDICLDSDQRFLELFYNKIYVPISLYEYGTIDHSYTYVYNLYAMLKAYQENKEDFDKFKIVVEDLAHLFNDFGDNDIEPLSVRRDLIDKIVKSDFYPTSTLLRDLMVRLMSSVDDKITDEEKQRLNTMFKWLEQLSRDKKKYLKLGYVGNRVNPEIFDVIVDDITLLVHNDLLPGCEPFYDPILILGDRYRTLKEAIKIVPANHREEVYSYFTNLDIGLFEEKPKRENQDAFIECIENIFDSDTYFEFLNKLTALAEANKQYTNFNKEEAFRIIEDLASDKHKQIFSDIVLKFPDCTNQVDKPKSISERTKQLYIVNNLMPDNFNWDILDSNLYPLSSLNERLTAEMIEYRVYQQQLHEKETETQKPKTKSKLNFFKK